MKKHSTAKPPSGTSTFLPRTNSTLYKLGTGTIYEVLTPRGFAYLQFVQWRQDWEYELLRVVPRYFKTRVVDTDELPIDIERYYTWCSLRGAIKKKWVSVVGRMEIASKWKSPPEFRSYRPALPIEDAQSWAFCVDAKKQIWKKVTVAEMSEQQKDLPPDDLIGFASLLLQLCTNWHPRDELGLKLGQEPRKAKAFRKKWPDFERNFAEYLKADWRAT
jgi:hypothetical protein